MKIKPLVLISFFLIGMNITGCLFVEPGPNVVAPEYSAESPTMTKCADTPTPKKPEPTIGPEIHQEDFALDEVLFLTCNEEIVRYDPGKREAVSLTHDTIRIYRDINLVGDKLVFLRTTDVRPEEIPGGQLVYGGGGFGPEEIFRMNLDGSHLEQLTEDGFFTLAFSVSPMTNELMTITDHQHEEDRWVITLFDAETLEKKLIHNSDVRITHLYWSPDGSQVAFFDYDSTRLFLLNINQEKTIELLPNEKLSNTLAWSPDGQQIVVGLMNGDQSALGIVDIKNETLIYTKPIGDSLADFDWSPDGKKIIFETIVREGVTIISAKLWLLDLSSNEMKVLYSGNMYSLGYSTAWSSDSKYVAFFTDFSVSGESHYKVNVRNIYTWEGAVDELHCSYVDRAIWVDGAP